jgi:hypothetical protein
MFDGYIRGNKIFFGVDIVTYLGESSNICMFFDQKPIWHIRILSREIFSVFFAANMQINTAQIACV